MPVPVPVAGKHRKSERERDVQSIFPVNSSLALLSPLSFPLACLLLPHTHTRAHPSHSLDAEMQSRQAHPLPWTFAWKAAVATDTSNSSIHCLRQHSCVCGRARARARARVRQQMQLTSCYILAVALPRYSPSLSSLSPPVKAACQVWRRRREAALHTLSLFSTYTPSSPS